MDSLQKKQLTFAKIADTPLFERPSLPIRISADREVVVALLSSWVAEVSEAEEVDSAEEASVEVASEAVVQEADFKVRTSVVILSIAKDLMTPTLCFQILRTKVLRMTLF
jgi:hypothetical protein